MAIVIVAYLLYLFAARPRPFAGRLVGEFLPTDLGVAVPDPVWPWG